MKRLLPFVVLILLLLAGICSVPFLLSPEKHRKEISDSLSTLLKRPVILGPMSMGYLPPTLRVEQVAVMNDSNSPILQVGTVSAPLDWAGLFRLRIVPEEVELSHWTLAITRKADGRWDIEDYLPGTTGLSGAKSWSLRRVYWKEGEIHWNDPFASVPQELVLASVQGQWDPRPEVIDSQGTFTGIAAGVHLSFSAKGQFFTSPRWTGDLQLSDQSNSAAFHITKAADSIDIKGQSPKWNMANALSFLRFYGRGSVASVDGSAPLTLDNWQLSVKVQGGHLSFEHSASISGGLSEAKGSINQTPVGLLAHADIATKDVPAQAILSLAGSKVLLDGSVTMVIKGFEAVLSSATLSSLKGEGSIELKDGLYHLPEGSVKKLARAKTMTYIKKKFPDLTEKGFPVAKLSGRWNAKNGIAVIEDGLLVSTDIKAGWVGKMDLAREGLDGYLRFEVHEKDAQKRRLLPAKYQTQPAFGRLLGTWQEWTLRSVSTTKIPSVVQGKLRRAVQGK